MMLEHWAAKHGVSTAALAELRQLMVATGTDPLPIAGVSEAAVQNQVRLEASKLGLRLWRNNVGVLTDERGVPVRYGLANDTPAMNKTIKSADLIGIRPILIQPHHVGTVIGQFVSREVKRVGWVYRGNAHEAAQLKWAELVNGLGGDATFAAGLGSFTDTSY